MSSDQTVPRFGSKGAPIQFYDDSHGDLCVVGHRKPNGVLFVTILKEGEYQAALKEIFRNKNKSKR